MLNIRGKQLGQKLALHEDDATGRKFDAILIPLMHSYKYHFSRNFDKNTIFAIYEILGLV